MGQNTPLQKTIALINEHQRFLLLMHERPDGDTIACSLAFAEALKQLGKDATCVSRDPIPQPFRFLPGSNKIESDFVAQQFDVMIVLDCGDLRRTGFPDRVRAFAQQKGRVLHIDHHQKSDLYKLANIKLFDSSAAATGQILYRLFHELPVEITSTMATCLLTSLYYDTGAFKHSNTTDEVLRLAAQLMHLGAKLRHITANVELTKSVASLKLWGIALQRIKKHQRFNVVTSFLTQDDLRRCQASEEDVAGVVNLLNAVPETRAAMLLYETNEGMIRASLRTEQPNVDVSVLAQLFGGGGLRKASGFCLPGKLVQQANNWHVQLVE